MLYKAKNPKKILTKRKQWLLLIMSLVIVGVMIVLFHSLVESYILDEAEKRVRDVMLERRALHHYIQRNAHPDLYALKADGELPENFYSPVLLSSSYMARNIHKYFNEERRAAGFPDIQYRMAAVNPRNIVNQASVEETALIDLFNQDETITEYRDIIEVDGKKYLYYALPFLRVKQACLKCHGTPEDAPRLLRERYTTTDEGGYGRQIGQVIAIESFQSPLQAELRTAHFILAIILAILMLIVVLFFTNTKLHGMVQRYTKDLHDSETQLQAAQRQEAVGYLAGGLAHDFNNLLMPIMYYTSEAIQTVGADSSLGRKLAMSFKAAEQAQDLTKQLLTLAKEKVTETRLMNLNELIKDFEHIIRPIIRENINLCIHLAEHLGLINANHSQIQQVLLNLVINAQKAMLQDGTLTIETVNVHLNEEDIRQCPDLSSGKYIVLSVKDTGIGIDDQVKAHLYEPFFTTKSRTHGTGLGLATVYSIVHQHGGCIRFDSELGRGTTFMVYFPHAGNAELPASTVSEPISHTMGKGTVLVAEDDQRVRDIVADILIKAGYYVHVAEDTNDAITIADRIQQIDLLVADVVMPGMNGRELYETLSANKREMEVLYISGYTEGVLSDHGIDQNRMNLLTKPFSMQELLEKVREILKQS